MTPTPRAFVDRARSLVVRMHAVERWAYALEGSVPADKLEGALAEAGYVRVERDDDAKVTRYEAATPGGRPDGLVTLERPDLALVLLQAHGAGTPERLRRVLDVTGFVPQSKLLRAAHDPTDSEASKALNALAHMVVAWDDDWSDLFLLHLASPDPIVRHEACKATLIAALSCGAWEPARTLLNEAKTRERYPQLRQKLTEAVELLETAAKAPAPPAP